MAGNRISATLALWMIIALYASARVLQISPGRVPTLAIVALHVALPMVFALIHGAISYRVRDIAVFLAVCLVIGNVFENVGVLTGFPFGHYYFTDVMGPKLFAVPIFLGLAYVGMAYLSWTLASLILGDLANSRSGWRVVTLPLIAAFIMVAWDLSQEPVWGTILHLWIWRDGGAYFGVPVSNFFGWYLCVYLIFQFFVLYLRNRSTRINTLPPSHWHLAVIFYAVSAGGNILLVIPRAKPPVISDAAGASWRVRDISGTCALISIFVMGAFALLAWTRVSDQETSSRIR